MFDWLNMNSKTVVASIGAILLAVGGWMQAGQFDLGSLIDLIQGILPYLVAIFLRHGVSKIEKKP